MKWIKLALISAVILFLVVFLMSLLIPGHVRISRAVNIRASQQDIVARLGDLRTWTEWNEPVQNLVSEAPAVSAHQIMSNSLKIFAAGATADTVKTVWQNRKGREISGVFTLQTAGDVTIVQWYFDFYQSWYPWEKFASINLDKQWGPAMERSLEKLKKMFETGQ